MYLRTKNPSNFYVQWLQWKTCFTEGWMLNGIHSFNKYLFSKYYVPGTILDIGKLAISNIDKTKQKQIPALMEFTYTQT